MCDRSSVADTLLGNITSSFPYYLTPGQSATITKTRVVLNTDPDPLDNTVTAIYTEEDDGTEVTAEASHSVDLVHPDFTLIKTADPIDGTVGTEITYTMVITNIGNVQVNRVSVNDTLMGNIGSDFPSTLAPGASATIVKAKAIEASDRSPLVNKVTAVYQVDGLPNQLSRKAQASIQVPDGGIPEVPTLSIWGIWALILLFCAAMVWVLRRKLIRGARM